ncbi:Quinone oxidoreductase [hydrothermal vent metagenome]|uniref:Quinone oxidoreductase n=1 Tax=hydrothermal vent metagenome TaxID=652676 RepID=A0A3B0SD07_9ZZZZ
MKEIRISRHGGPEVLEYVAANISGPKNGEVQIRHTQIGLNFIDTYHRSGLYPMSLPSGIGLEACGVVEAVGSGVEHLVVGDRVAYGAGPIGAYSQIRNMPAGRVSKLPDSVDDETAAAIMLKGMTARYLLRETYKVQAGDTILFHAAAGGVGQIAIQWANALGATVIGTVGSTAKGEMATALGCHHVINYNEENVADRVREITDGKGVPVVYDGVGQSTIDASLDSLQPRGLLVSFGNASGPVTDFDLGKLAAKGSLYITRPSLMAYVATDEALAANARDLFEMVGSGKVKINVNQRYRLSEAAQAHRDLEARKTTGSSVLSA